MADPRYKNGVYVGWGNARRHQSQQQILKAASLPRNGWEVAANLNVVDPDLLRAITETNPTIYQLTRNGQSAWAYVSKQKQVVAIVMTNSDKFHFYDRDQSFVAITNDVTQRLAAEPVPVEVLQ